MAAADEKERIAKQRAAEREAAREARMAELKAEREQRAAEAAAARASKPATNPKVRPEGSITDDKIEYFSWIGGGTTGSWKKYVAPNTDENMAKYGARTVGGETQNKLDGSSAGANALVARPTPIKDSSGNIIGYQGADGKAVSSALPPGYKIDMTAVKAAGNAIDAALANRAWLSVEDPMLSLQALGSIIEQFHKPGSPEYMSALVSAAQMGSRSHTDINGETGTLAKFLNETISAEQGKQIGIDTIAFQIGSDRYGAPPRQNLPYTGGAGMQNLPFTGGASTQNLPFLGGAGGTGAMGGTGTGMGTTTPTGPSLARDTFKNTLSLFFGPTEAAKPWTDALYESVSKFYRSGSDITQSFNLALLDARNKPELKPFTDRFRGIYALQDMKNAGRPITVPTIAEYVASQTGMSDIFNQAGLGDLATEEFTTELISKGNSVTTIADKISQVYNRIDSAPRTIKDTLSRFYPTVDRTKLARTLLLGEKGVNALVDELQQYEVLAAAEQQGVGAINRPGGVTLERAGEFARGGGTYASLLPKFAAVREVTPTASKLAGISKARDIGQVGVEQAIISGLAQPMEELRQLGEEEVARFSGKTGRAELGLASQRRANRAF